MTKTMSQILGAPARTHECEECHNDVSRVRPCYDWDPNSISVCDDCRDKINAEHPEGDE